MKGEYSGSKCSIIISAGCLSCGSGWVRTVFYHDLGIDNSSCLLKAKVNPSQRSSDKPHEPWVAVTKKEGRIITGHCTCMAG